jgi:hypothetical protein
VSQARTNNDKHHEVEQCTFWDKYHADKKKTEESRPYTLTNITSEPRW